MAQEPILTKAGAVRMVDSSNFPAAKLIAAGLVEVEPGGMRGLQGGVGAALIALLMLILLRLARRPAAVSIWRSYLPEVSPA